MMAEAVLLIDVGNTRLKWAVVRDGVLGQSPEGRAIIELYYRWSPLIARAVREDDQLREEIKGLVGDMIDLITAR
mgnify:CR=1 FL=1